MLHVTGRRRAGALQAAVADHFDAVDPAPHVAVVGRKWRRTRSGPAPRSSAATAATGMQVAACGLWLATDGTLHLW